MNNQISVFLLCFTGIILLMILYAAPIIRWYKNNHSPICSIEAVMINKEDLVTFLHDYYVYFRLENGQVRKFLTDSYVYHALDKGQKGILYYQGTRFLRYDRDED